MLIFSYISTIYLYSSRKNDKIYEVYFQQSFKNYIHAQTSASFACNCLSWHAHTLLQYNYTTTVLIRILCTIITNVKYEKKLIQFQALHHSSTYRFFFILIHFYRHLSQLHQNLARESTSRCINFKLLIYHRSLIRNTRQLDLTLHMPHRPANAIQ